MLDLRRILCPIDLAEFSLRTYRYASSLAWHHHSLLYVQHVVELWRYPSAGFAPSPGAYEEFCGALHKNGEKQLQEFVKNNTHDAIEMVRLVDVDEGFAADSILAFAEAQKTDLIVMGTHGRQGVDRLMLGSVTEGVMRKASCPVLVVNRGLPEVTPPGTRQDSLHLSRLLFCTDFSEHSQRALDYATSLAAEYNAELTLLHVLDGTMSSAHQKALAKAAANLDQLIPQPGIGDLRHAGDAKRAPLCQDYVPSVSIGCTVTVRIAARLLTFGVAF